MCRALALLAALLTTAAMAEDVAVRDPMRPARAGAAGPGSAVAAQPRFALTAVLIASERRVAIVNGTPYRLGATIDGAELVAIEPHGVRLREANAEHEILLARAGSGRRADLQGGKSP